VYHADLFGSRELKYEYLRDSDIQITKWVPLAPESPFYLFVPRDAALAAEYQNSWIVTEIFPINSVGIVTARDNLTIGWSPEEIWETLLDFVRILPEDAREKYHLGKDVRDWKVHLAQMDVKSSGPSRSKVAKILYRPFDLRFTYYTGQTRSFICMPRPHVMNQLIAGHNIALISARSNKSGNMDHFLLRRRSWRQNVVNQRPNRVYFQCM
jgi:hypothetical protein